MKWVSRLTLIGLLFVSLSACAQQPKVTQIKPGEPIKVSPEIEAMTRALAARAETDPKLATFRESLRKTVAQIDAGKAINESKTFQDRQREDANRPVNWHTRFTFEGQVRPGPYTVDPHVWVYTKEFAERFGMPKEWINEELKGVEAAAWRKTKTGYVTCGWGGKKDACKEEDSAILELYFDTRKVKLPWAPWSKEADQMQLHWWVNSQRFLTSQQCERRREPSRGSLSNNWGDERSCVYYAMRKPLSDPSNESEVGVFVKGVGYSGQGNMAGVGAYDKHAYPNLAWIQIALMPTMINMGRPEEDVVISFETRTAPLGKTLKIFHEIIIPQDFVGRMISAFKANQEKDRAFYKKALGME